MEEIVGKSAGLGKAITALANLEVDPPITIATLKVVLLNEFHQNVSNFNADVFGVWHWSIEVEVLEVNGAETCTWARKHAVEKKLDKFKGRGVGSPVTQEADAIAADRMRVQSGSSFSGRTLHTTMVWQISFHLWHGMLW